MANKIARPSTSDLVNKNLVQMLRGGRASNSKYAVVDAQRREVHTAPPGVKPSGKLPKHWLPKVKAQKLTMIFR